MSQLLDGPRLTAKSGTPKQLAVFLHGYGADGRDLIDIGRQWQTLLPDCAFVAPHAPEPCAMSPTGRQWFTLSTRSDEERWSGVCKARPSLDAFLDAELAKYGLDDTRLALIGFSQGTMMALHVGLRRKYAPLIVGYSGLLAGAQYLHEASARRKHNLPPAILLTHGSEDAVIPVEAFFEATNALALSNLPCQWHLVLGLGHGIDESCLKHGGEFLAHGFDA